MGIYVGNLSYDITQDGLSEVFAEYGEIKSIYLPADRETGSLRGFAFINMGTDEEETLAIETLNGAEWMGRNLKVNKARPRSN